MGIVDDFGVNGYLPDMSAPYYTQDYIPIKNIFGGIIYTKDERYLKIMEIAPINLESKSLQERDDIIYDFRSWLSVAPVNIQIKIITGRSNPDKIINKIIQRYQNDNDVAVENIIQHYTDLLYTLGNSGAVAKHFYMIISYEPKASSKKNPEIEDIVQELNETAQSIKTYLERIGNLVLPLSETGNPEDEQWAVLEFLYKLYNPRSSVDEMGRPAITLQKRTDRILADKRKISRDDDVMLQVDDILAPLEIDITKPDAVVFDGKYHSYLLVKGNGFPQATMAGWFDSLFSLAPGENVDLFIHKEPKGKFLRDVSQKIKFTGVKLSDKNANQADYEKTENALYAASYIKQAMNNGGEDPFYITLLITLTAYTYEDIKKRKAQVMEFYKTKGIDISPLNYIQEEAMRSSFPFLDLSPKLYTKGKRNILSSGLASCYPFISADMCDNNGVLMGLDMVNNTMCMLNPFNRRAYKNANMFILGTAGSGKTYTEQLMALRMRAMGIQCFIIAPDKAHEFKRACDYGVKGEFITIAASSKDHINIMDIRPVSSESAALLEGSAFNNTSYVSEKTESIISFISLLIPELENEDEQIIGSCIMNVYRNYGITEDNDSIYIDPNNKEKGLKEMPIIGDLYEELLESEVSKKIINIMSQFVTGYAQSFNKRTNVDLNNKYIVFDISNLKGRLLSAGMFVALDFIVGRIREDVTEQKMVFIDEGWQLIGTDGNEKAAEYVKWLFKIIRGYNGGACIATQELNDFLSLKNGEYGKAIISNSQIKMILNLSAKEAELVKDELVLTRGEMRNIQNYNTGECLVCANTNHIPIRIIGSDYETKLITTDPDKVKMVVDEMKKNNGKL